MTGRNIRYFGERFIGAGNRWRSCHALVLLLLGLGCGTRTETVVLHRSACAVCHQPLNEEQVPEGIVDPHPWHPLSCVDCHGGTAFACTSGPALIGPDGPRCDDGFIYSKDRSHPSPGTGPSVLRGLSPRQLDGADPEWIRFVNPGDLRVVQYTCGGSAPGAAGAGGCHTAPVEQLADSLHAHGAGLLAAPRYRAGVQTNPMATVAAVERAGQGDSVCDIAGLTRLDPSPADLTMAMDLPTAQEHYLAKRCATCHVSALGPSDHAGNYRSSGCSACHVPYADDGVGIGADPRVAPGKVPRPVTHTLVARPADTQCLHCHHESGRIGLHYNGWRPAVAADAAGIAAGQIETLGRAVYGFDADGIVVDEDTSNTWDETPPDVHQQAGMQCVDCHRGAVHGTGVLGSTASCVPARGCESCHGDASARADANGALVVEGQDRRLTLASGAVLTVPQVLDAITPGSAAHNPAAQEAMTGAHLEQLECWTCHSGWMSSCYGCHVEMDFTQEARSLTTGVISAGAPTEVSDRIVLNDLVLIRGPSGRIAPSMPVRMLMSALVPDSEGAPQLAFADHPRRFPGPSGPQPGFGQRAINPHTIVRRSSFMACNRCHSQGSVEAPDNAALLDLTLGNGTGRFEQVICDVRSGSGRCDDDTTVTVRLDALRGPAGPQVVPGPPGATLLEADTISLMRSVVVLPRPDDIPPPPSDTQSSWPPASPPSP